ncbi:MAG: hypothetical protein HY978_00850, partial [Candidatus Liptonbacteria bacterium]|nr:hypothetical protein [Candidatus Liptonbacteria bacterium]
IVGTPTASSHAATKSYVDSSLQTSPTWTVSGNNVYNSNSGNVGIGTTVPGYKFDVNGTGSFANTVIVGTPTASSHAATKSYVDSAVTGGTVTKALACDGDATCEMNGADLKGTGSITGVVKLTVATIDPLYRIGGVNYSTYVPSIAGQVREEFSGRGKTVKSGKNYRYLLDFSSTPQGSDLWLWHQAVEFSRDTVEAVATPYGQAASIWYEIVQAQTNADGTRTGADKLIFYSDKPVEFSFRLTGYRHDWREWPVKAKDQTEKATFVLP